MSQKPVKLRAACNQCNATKVKCSGEKSGCTRCQTFQVPCVYAESRVGRVPGIRAKRKRKTDGIRSADFAAEANVEATDISEASSGGGTTKNFEPVSSPQTTSHSGNRTPAAVGSIEDVMSNWNTEMNGVDAFHDEEFLANLSPTEQQQMSPLGDDHFGRESQPSFSRSNSIFNISGLNFDSCDFQSQPFQASNRSWSSDPTVADAPGLQARISAAEHLSNHGQCVIACSQIILSLERYLIDDLKVLDFILGIIKRVTIQLNPLIELHHENQDTKCLSLFSVICYQIVELLEAGCAKLFAEEMDQTQNSNSFDILSSSLPGLGFDTFNINSRNQRRWRSQIILDEVQPLSKILRSLDDLMAAKLQAQHTCCINAAKSGCCRDLIIRLDTLIEQLKR